MPVPPSFTLSVLDQSMVASGRTPAAAIHETMALARHVEALGYRRFWMSEHHNSGALAGTAPEVLAAAIAATTSRIRVGTAGVMLPHYSSLKVAEQFRVLEAVAPGRIDLGVGRAPGSDGRTAFALNPNAAEAADRFPAQLMEVMGWLGDGLPENHPFRMITAQPVVETRPEVWVLGSSDYGAQVAAYFGLPHSFAHFFTDGGGSEQALAVYRETFRPHPGVVGRLGAPHPGLGVFCIAADTEAEALRLFRSRELWRLNRDRGLFVPLPAVEEAEAYAYSDVERARVARMRERAMIGAPEQVRAKLEALSAQHGGVAEFAVVTACHDPEARRRSFALLAEACGLRPEDAGRGVVATEAKAAE